MNTMTHGPSAAQLERLMVFTGNANPRLAQEVARYLNLSLGRAIVGKFSDGEVMVELLENVRGKDVFVLQSTCAPTNDNLMELLVMVDALKRSSAARVTAAIPYFGYARQDRRQAPSEGQRQRSHERDRRGSGSKLRHHGRHGRYRGHAGEGCPGAEGGRRHQGGRLLHARR